MRYVSPDGYTCWTEGVEFSANQQGELAEETVVLDPPGQPELTTHHAALPRILQRLEKKGHRVESPPLHRVSALAD